jgi:archaellum biogenesis protein FlaJ (TadC family)
LLPWLAVFSVTTFFGTLIALPILIIRIPEDYFMHEKRKARSNTERLMGFRLFSRALKNTAGLFFILIGIVMLFLPGQGLLSILIGTMLTDFPGKYRLERALIKQQKVMSTINWLRARRHRPPLQVEND